MQHSTFPHSRNSSSANLGLVLIAVTALLGLVFPSHAQVLFDGSYSQNFNTLKSNTTSGGTTTATYTNNTTLEGWYASVGTGSNNARASSGAASGSGGGLYYWGALNSSDMSFGTFSAVSGGFASPPTYVGVQLMNSTAITYTSLSISYDVEQWRQNATSNTLTLEYLVTSATGNQVTASGYTSLPLTVVTSLTGSSSGLNGNVFFTSIDVDVTGISWTPGTYLWLRWANSQGANTSSSALSVDNFTIVPEPSTMALLAFMGLGVFGIRSIFRARKWALAAGAIFSGVSLAPAGSLEPLPEASRITSPTGNYLYLAISPASGKETFSIRSVTVRSGGKDDAVYQGNKLLGLVESSKGSAYPLYKSGENSGVVRGIGGKQKSLTVLRVPISTNDATSQLVIQTLETGTTGLQMQWSDASGSNVQPVSLVSESAAPDGKAKICVIALPVVAGQ